MSRRGPLLLLAGAFLLFAGRESAEGAPSPFRPPQRPDAPAVKDKSWCVNPIDAFVLARLEQEGLAPNPEADQVTLLSWPGRPWRPYNDLPTKFLASRKSTPFCGE